MALLNMFPRDRGFIIFEIIVALAILTIILSFGLFVSFDFYKNYSFRSEKNFIVSILQRARNQSLNNVNQTRHGVYFQKDPLKYIIFSCPVFNPQCEKYIPNANDIVINPSYGISIENLPFEIIFNQLDGASSERTITVHDGIKSYNITINQEGQINW